MISKLARFRRDRAGQVAIEFVFIFPVLILMTTGVLDLAFIGYEYHKATEATRRGVRAALINDAVADLTQLSNGTIVCTGGSSVSCSRGSVKSSSAFTAIVQAVQEILPEATSSNVSVSYADSGVTVGGSADIVTPAITVSIVGLRHDFFALKFFPGLPTSLTLPGFNSTQLAASVLPE